MKREEALQLVALVVARSRYGSAQRDLALLAAVALSEAAKWPLCVEETDHRHASSVTARFADACAADVVAFDARARARSGLQEIIDLGTVEALDLEARAPSNLFEAAWRRLSSNDQPGDLQGLAEKASGLIGGLIDD